jgi:glycogen operon protein
VQLWSAAARSITVVVASREAPTVAVTDVPMTREGDTWTARIPAAAIGDADLYGFRVEGDGPRFDPSKLLLDPEAHEVWFPPAHDREAAKVRGRDTLGCSPFGVLCVPNPRPPMPKGPRHPIDQLVIYEAHVRGATLRDEGVHPRRRGTFAGLAAHAARLAALGVTAVELLPVHQFDPREGNYWGYMPLAWNALHDAYVTEDAVADDEFRAMVQTFHANGIEVLLDVVYNHTTEEDELGPTYHFRAIDDAAYYIVDADGRYNDDAGCGNVFRAAHPPAGAIILDSLRRFAGLGVDGFRFDLGSLLGRDLGGRVLTSSPLIDEITRFASEHDVRLITEPWDLASYQLGPAFPGHTWAQWNGRFRDDCRAFLRAEEGSAAAFATRVVGSPDLFDGDSARSINFVTAHDGFTLYDLVAYEHKHNEANGHGNSDGTDDNRSWNCGAEGETDDPAINALRLQQMKNAFVLLLLSAGVPMMLAGDEFAQTQGGNNNPYNQDNATTWLDWERAPRFEPLTDFVRQLLGLRRDHAGAPVVLHGVDEAPDLGRTSHSLAWQRGDLYVMANAWWEPLTFRVWAEGEWDVALSSGPVGVLSDGRFSVPPRTTAVLRRVVGPPPAPAPSR